MTMSDPLEELEALEAAEEAAEAAAAAAAGENSEPPADPPPADELILGKFKTTEDALTAYTELERARTQDRQELAEARRMAAEAMAAAEAVRAQQNQPPPDPNEQQYLPNGTPYYSDAQFDEWTQQAMDNQDGRLMQAVVAARADRDFQLQQASLREELRREFAPTQARQEERDAQETLDEINRLVGPEVVNRHADEALRAMKRFGTALDGATPQETAREVARYIRGLDAEMGTTPPAPPTPTPEETRQRDPRTGKFVTADDRTVHVEGGSGPQPTPVNPDDTEDEDIRELLSYREGSDAFGKR
jgi:hypothetical protein